MNSCHGTKILKNKIFRSRGHYGAFTSVPAAKPEPKKRGRKPKVKEQSETTPRRPRGRPRKATVSQNTEN